MVGTCPDHSRQYVSRGLRRRIRDGPCLGRKGQLMDGNVLIFPRNNDVVVTARYPDISDGTGSNSVFYYKDNRYVSDDDPSTQMYQAPIVDDPDNPGATMSQFTIPADDNLITGAFWWRVDCVDSLNSRRTAQCGTLLVEAV